MVEKDKSVLGTLPKARPKRIGAPRTRAATPKPRAVSPGAAALTHTQHPPPPEPLEAPKGAELVTTAIRATGELAQIGFMLGGRTLKRALKR
jgi:hypothetical protein